MASSLQDANALVWSGQLNRILEIPSLPKLPQDDVFWDRLRRLCLSQRISCLNIDNRGAPGVPIPLFPRLLEHENQSEFVIDLRNPTWEDGVARKHWQNIKRARQSRVVLQRSTTAEACQEHVNLMSASMARRTRRGEQTPGDIEETLPTIVQLTAKGAAELFRAVQGTKVLSSALVLKAAEGAYYETAGTSPEGMRCGASHFLIYSVARTLRQESIGMFNLGLGADPGITMFKSRFGATPLPLEYLCFYFGSDLRLRLTVAAHYLRHYRSAIFRGRG